MEQGKTLPEARIEVMMNVGLFRFYAGEVFRLYGRALVRPSGLRATVIHEPVGPVAAFAPWNFPLGNPGRKLGAPIAAGCSVILKAAEETRLALGVLQCLYDAGLPQEVAQAVFGEPAEVSSYLLRSPVIRKLSFTGSTQVGKLLIKLAAEDLKRTTMELGGHGPVLVFDDADVDQALDAVVPHKFRNAGQVCVARRVSSWRKACTTASSKASSAARRRSASATDWRTACRWGRWPTPAGPRRWSADRRCRARAAARTPAARGSATRASSSRRRSCPTRRFRPRS
jgi:acyl-CoA reductase-like NAD-dependent aldehyde dehydrogenase